MRALSLTGVPTLLPQEGSRRRYGLVDTETWRGHKEATGEELEVYFDGVLVNPQAANDIEGFIQTYVGISRREEMDRRIQDYLARGKGEYIGERKVRLYGDVRIAPKAKTPEIELHQLSVMSEQGFVLGRSAAVATWTRYAAHTRTSHLCAVEPSTRIVIDYLGSAVYLETYWKGAARMWPIYGAPIRVETGGRLDLRWEPPDYCLLSITDLALQAESR